MRATESVDFGTPPSGLPTLQGIVGVDLPGGGLKGFQVAQGMLVESGGFIGMIQHVREQTRSVGQIALSDAGTVHAWISLTDEQGAAKDSMHPGGTGTEVRAGPSASIGTGVILEELGRTFGRMHGRRDLSLGRSLP